MTRPILPDLCPHHHYRLIFHTSPHFSSYSSHADLLGVPQIHQTCPESGPFQRFFLGSKYHFPQRAQGVLPKFLKLYADCCFIRQDVVVSSKPRHCAFSLPYFFPFVPFAFLYVNCIKKLYVMFKETNKMKTQLPVTQQKRQNYVPRPIKHLCTLHRPHLL